MTRLAKLTLFVSALAITSLAASPFAAADKFHRPCTTVGCVDEGAGPPDSGDDQDDNNSHRRHQQTETPDDQNAPDQGMPSQHARKKYHPDDQFKQGGDDNPGMDQQRVRHADRKWQYDSHRHERRRHKDDRFRFYFGGFWYPEPYWDEPYGYDDYDDYADRVSCREGADIVSERFARVRIVECYGRVYTYLGRRHGETFQIELSARSGRILDAHEI